MRLTPCWAGYCPVSNVARLGEHMAVLQKAFSNVRPVRASVVSFGASAWSQPGSSGQWRGWRC